MSEQTSSPAQRLGPKSGLLQEEYVLVQAWKKTSSYIRYHNSFADILELDEASVNLATFLEKTARALRSPEDWVPDPLRLVPAPKSSEWHVTSEGKWLPVSKRNNAVKSRPLGHASLKDQVGATAIMLCLADRVETRQGDPRIPPTDTVSRRNIISYGNRLFCDEEDGVLVHRWGSGKLYRAYFHDYRTFVGRPEAIGSDIRPEPGRRIVVVHSDLRQFFDRVRPQLLHKKIAALMEPDDDVGFFEMASRVLDWRWHPADRESVKAYGRQSDIADFSTIALPQGLVSAGFFANVVLLDFDRNLRRSIYSEISPGVEVIDVCRYVDDMRILMQVDSSTSDERLKGITSQWLNGLLDEHAPGLEVAENKTKVTELLGEKHSLVFQSKKMQRIQSAVSGGFDPAGGEHILDAIQGLIRSQQRHSDARLSEQSWQFAPVADVADATVSRFAAARFRSTFRSLRPILEVTEAQPIGLGDEEAEAYIGRTNLSRTQPDLDGEARTFALGLVENWTMDPSNVRLLRIGLDLWPSKEVLEGVLGLIRPYTEKGANRGAVRQVAWYCLSEIFRAGATETGVVEDPECLPEELDLETYRSVLKEEAARLLALGSRVPWYLRQQVFLFLAAFDPSTLKDAPHRTAVTKLYGGLINYLNGNYSGLRDAEFATAAVIARRSFYRERISTANVANVISSKRFIEIVKRDIAFALEILNYKPELQAVLSQSMRMDIGLAKPSSDDATASLTEVVLEGKADSELRSEAGVLRFTLCFIDAIQKIKSIKVITPANVQLAYRLGTRRQHASDALEFRSTHRGEERSIYEPPPWCPASERWRFQLGYLLRFILCAHPDFTESVRPSHWKEQVPIYRGAGSAWLQRHYGFYNGQPAFGDDWLPISDWVEKFLYALLRWPGCQASATSDIIQLSVSDTRKIVSDRLTDIEDMARSLHDPSTCVLPLVNHRPDRSTAKRPLRACVLQTVIPTDGDFSGNDLSLSSREIRKRHRRHLSAALASIENLLKLRDTHLDRGHRLDWLILPELSVHPTDVTTHLIPFARKYKTIIVAGLTYQQVVAGDPLVNSAIWIVPVWTRAHGAQVIVRRQGKRHLAPAETKLNCGEVLVHGFRPCQWLVGYEWKANEEPMWLTSAICYDATDLDLSACLRRFSDVLAVLALNKDVDTFDQMALMLHYHMFQYVVVANNGKYGGSNAYAPYKDRNSRLVFHLHGQPQASAAFFDIDDIAKFLSRKTEHLTGEAEAHRFKSPPAGI